MEFGGSLWDLILCFAISALDGLFALQLVRPVASEDTLGRTVLPHSWEGAQQLPELFFP